MDFNEISVAVPQNVNMSQELINMGNFQILDEGPRVSQELNMTNLPLLEGPQVSQDLNLKNFQILEEGPRVCPLCSQEIRMYFINYNEKIEMCENLECDYPFGHEPLKVLREENGVQTVEIKSLTGKTRSKGCSRVSSQGWSDVDKLCNVFETDDESSNVAFSKAKTALKLRKTESDRRKAELLENVEKIKQMTKSMSEMKKEPKRVIKNEKWIKNLQYLQGLSGLNLLKPAEMKKIKKNISAPGSRELKIDIDKSNVPSIKIELNRAAPPGAKHV